jgi:hypothetical protein
MAILASGTRDALTTSSRLAHWYIGARDSWKDEGGYWFNICHDGICNNLSNSQATERNGR